MATTYAGILPATSNLDLILKHLGSSDRALLDLVNSGVESKNGVTTIFADYVYNAGLAGDKIVASARRTYDAKQNKTSCSFRITSALRKTVSETGEVSDTPIEAGVFWNYEGELLPSVAEVNDLIQVTFGTLFFTLTGANGSPTTGIVSAFDRGVISNLY